MVITAVRPDVAAVSNGVAKTETKPFASPHTTRRQYCNRCGTQLVMGYYEPQCLNCGFVDYTYTDEATSNGDRSILSAATRSVLRYVGDFPSLTHTLAQVRLIRVRNRVAYAVNCPFCKTTMEQSSLSGKRPDVREQRFKCMQGHRVSLVPGKNGMMGWR